MRTLWVNLNFEIAFFGLLSLFGLFYAITRRIKAGLLSGIWFITVGLGFLISAIYAHHFIQIIAPTA
jgi:hypothetical protein